MKERAVQGGQEGTIHPPTNCLDLYLEAVCSYQCTIAHDRHVQLLTVLPHTTFQFHSV